MAMQQDWMIAKLSLAAEAQMEAMVRCLEREGPDNVPQTIRIACSLTRQNCIQQALLKQALGRIIELETQLALGSANGNGHTT